MMIDNADIQASTEDSADRRLALHGCVEDFPGGPE